MLSLYQLFVFFVMMVFVASLVPNKKIRLLIVGLLSILMSLEIASVYMTNTLIDYRFYNHLNLDIILEQGFQFIYQIFIILFIYVLLIKIVYSLSSLLSLALGFKGRIAMSMYLMILLSLPYSMFRELYYVHQIIDAKQKPFKEALNALGISQKYYITPSELQASSAKNIIVISIESLEQNFLGNEIFDNLTPNLTALSKKWTFYDNMYASKGGGWTAGSLYSYQVGIPAYFKGQGNAFFQGITDVNITGLGHVLSKAGYDARYLVGNAEFAGMKDLLQAYKIKVISQNNCIGKGYDKSARCGLHDYDLFKEAKEQLKDFRKNPNKHFALFLSTINTHFPHGIYDKRMENFVKPRKEGVAFAVSAVDYLIGDFISYLKKEKLLKNTAIFIFPDHPLMGSRGSIINKLKTKKRKIYMITNINEQNLAKKTSQRLYQIDMTKMIIEGAGIKTNAKFLRDFIPISDYDKFLNKHRVDLTILNTASIIKKDFTQGIKIYIKDAKLIISSKDNNKIVFDLNTSAEVFDITLNHQMVAIEKKKIEEKELFLPLRYDEKFKRLHLFIKTKEAKLHKAYFGKTYKDEFTKKELDEKTKSIIYTKEEIKWMN